MWITSSLATAKTPTFVALGNFDGVHRGHRQVIQPILQDGIGPADRQILSTVVTFDPHPQEFFSGQHRSLLTPLPEKIPILQQLGLDQLVLLPFNAALASLPPEEFVEVILVQHLQAQRVSVGQNFRFGRGRAGHTADLQAIAAQFGVEVCIVPLYTADGERISSSAIRQALEQGEPDQARQLLGRPYQLWGEVVLGQQLGRTLGFPTANLKLPPEKFLPRQGVYSVWVQIGEEERSLPGVMNLGYRPTVEGTRQTIEVHLLDWTGDLYGQTLVVSLENFIRSEQKFTSLEELKAQIARDCETARAALSLSQFT